MIELGFGESSAGGLKVAKSVRQGERLEGSPQDVAALTLALDIGGISDMDADMDARKSLLDKLFEGFPGVSDGIWKTNQHALARLQEAQATLEPVRLWVCAGNPEELCGLCFVCRLMVDSQTPLSVVRIPERIETDNGIISYRSTGEIVPEAFGAFIRFEESMSELRRKANANLWRELVRENAPLRAVVNGRLIGVPEDFYDFALRANMPDGEFKVAQLVGRTLGQIPGIADRWLFLRIQAMLQSGELVAVSPGTGAHPYSGVVKRKPV